MKKVLALVVAATMGLSSVAFAAETATTPAPTATVTKAAAAKTTHHKKQHKAAPAQKAQAAKKHHKKAKNEQKAPETKSTGSQKAQQKTQPAAICKTRCTTSRVSFRQ